MFNGMFNAPQLYDVSFVTAGLSQKRALDNRTFLWIILENYMIVNIEVNIIIVMNCFNK